MIRELNIALIGCGNWGKNIARNLHQMESLACIYDTNTELSEKLSHKYNLPIFKLNKIFEDKNISNLLNKVGSDSCKCKSDIKTALMNELLF